MEAILHRTGRGRHHLPPGVLRDALSGGGGLSPRLPWEVQGLPRPGQARPPPQAASAQGKAALRPAARKFGPAPGVCVPSQAGNCVSGKVPVAEWDNPYFSAATPGSIAAKYYDFLHECYPLSRDNELRAGQIEQIVQYLRKEGKGGADQLALAVAGMGASFPDNAAVQELARSLAEELTQYNGPGQANAQRQKLKHKKSQER